MEQAVKKYFLGCRNADEFEVIQRQQEVLERPIPAEFTHCRALRDGKM